MSSPYALFRLMWRLAALGMAFPLFWAVVWPIASLSEGTEIPISALWHDPASAPVRKALWHLVVLLPAALGLFTWLPTQEVRASGLGWNVPGLRRGLRIGTLWILLPMALILGSFVSRGGGAMEGLAAVGLVAFCFLIPGTLMAPGARRLVDWVLIFLLMAAISLPRQIGAVVAAQPGLIAIGAIGSSLAMLRVQFGSTTARRQVLAAEWGAVLWTSRRWLGKWGGRGQWTRSLATNRLLPWIHAGMFEAGTGSTPRYVRSVVLGAIMLGAFSHWFGSTSMTALYLGMAAMHNRLQLASGLGYPLGRERRATHSYAAGAIHALFVMACFGAVLAFLAWLPIPEAWLSEPSRGRDLNLGLAALLVIPALPIVLWPVSLGGAIGKLKGGWVVGGHLGSLAAYALVTVMTGKLSRRWWESGDVSTLILAAVVVSVLTWTTLWHVTGRIYATRDLSADWP